MKKVATVDTSLIGWIREIERHSILNNWQASFDTNRINRRSFIENMIISTIFAYVLYIIVQMLIPPVSPDDMKSFQEGLPIGSAHSVLASNIVWIIIWGTFYWIVQNLSIKRYADLGDTWRIPRILIPVFLVINLYIFLMGIYSAYFWTPFSQNMLESVWFDIFSRWIGIFGIGAFISIIIMIVYLSIKKWDVWHNIYGQTSE